MRVLIVDDHPLYREGLRTLLFALDASVQVSDACDVAQAVALAHAGESFDLVLLDMNLPGASRLDALRQVKAAWESACLVVISGEEEPALILAAIEAGASGYIPKTTDAKVTVGALRLVLAHGVYLPTHVLKSMTQAQRLPPPGPEHPQLSDRQHEVLHRLLQGKPNKVIARELGIAEGTVKAHLWAVYQLMGVNSRAQAMCRVHELGLFRHEA